jgi:hypothetical protein
MCGLSSPPHRAHLQGTRGFRVLPSIGTTVLALAAALASPAVTSGPAILPLALAAPVAASWNARTLAPRLAEFGTHKPSPPAREIADWIADSRDNAGMAFVVIDKQAARLYVFDALARLRGSSPVLLGAARGDDSVADIGTRPLAEVLAHERTTPAGRFVAERGHNASGEDVIWVDYDAAVSMHRVRATNPKERRLQRLASATVADNRISYGCINVPVAFYESSLRPLFAQHDAIVYVLPETRPAQQVFKAYKVGAPRAASAEPALRLSRLQ